LRHDRPIFRNLLVMNMILSQILTPLGAYFAASAAVGGSGVVLIRYKIGVAA
jgi:hypothetical protein